MTTVGVPTLSVEAATLVGSVLLEAVGLYVGYGALERVVGPTIVKRVARS